MYRITCLFISFVVLIALFMWGCQTSGGGAVGTENAADPYTELENQMYLLTTSSINNPSDLSQIKFVHANELYRQAVVAHSTDASANFGAGLTEILSIYSDSYVGTMIARWDSVSLGGNSSFFKFGIPTGLNNMNVPTQVLAKNLTKMIQTAVVNPPLIGEMQNLMRDHFLPHINYALDRFAIAEQDTNFRFKISPKMQGNMHLDTLILDNGEVYIMDGALRGLKAYVEQFLVYRFDLPEYTTNAVVQALQPSNTTFFYLAIDGVARSQSVLNDVTSMISKFKSSIQYLKSETGDLSNHIIKIGQVGAFTITSAALDTANAYLDRAANYITSPQTITLHNADIDGNDYTIQVDIAGLYNYPPQNPKTAWFPAYSVDTGSHGDIIWRWTAQDYASFAFPDPTFNGLFPGMTNTDLKRILHIDEAFSWKLYVSLYDNTNPLPDSTSAYLLINGTIYNPKKSSSSYYSNGLNFYVLDNDSQPVEVVATIAGNPVTLLLSAPVQVKLNSSLNISCDLEVAPQTITGAGYASYIFLNFGNYPTGLYRIEKAVNGGLFTVIDSTSSSVYYDYSITSGQTYDYRAQLIPNNYNFSNYIYAVRANNYTNIVSIAIP